jgi:hypothetical protein
MVCARGSGSVGPLPPALILFPYLCVYRTANSCFKEAADILAETDEFQAAIKLYETVAGQSLSSALTKYSVREYWLKAILCALAMGVS